MWNGNIRYSHSSSIRTDKRSTKTPTRRPRSEPLRRTQRMIRPCTSPRTSQRSEALVAGHKRLLGDVSHELRSPLSRLIVALGLVKQGPKEEAGEHLDRIALEARRLDNLIGQLLTLSRIDSGSLAAGAISFD